jgi:S-adenosylmethionine decarboxylase
LTVNGDVRRTVTISDVGKGDERQSKAPPKFIYSYVIIRELNGKKKRKDAIGIYDTHGKHVIADVWGANPAMLNDMALMTAVMNVALDRCGATVIQTMSHRFTPQGLTVLALLAESHFSIHTYPERGFCAIDVYTCCDSINPEVAVDYVVEALGAADVKRIVVRRGYEGNGMEAIV